jgi:hypothetical protein
MTQEHRNRRQLVIWNAIAQAVGGVDAAAEQATKLSQQMATQYGLPPALLDPRPPIDQLIRRHPALEDAFLSAIPSEDADPDVNEDSVKRALLFSKLLVNVFGPQGAGTVSAQQLNNWQSDTRFFQRCVDARSQVPQSLYARQQEATHDPNRNWKAPGSGGAPTVHGDDVQHALDEIRAGRGLMSSPEIKAALERTEKGMINRMALREILKDPKLVEKMTPSMALTEQLLRDKDNLEGPALQNAKRLIRRFIQDLSDVIRKDVQSTTKGKIDPKTPPRRTFANLDLKKTIWKNLINWSPEEGRLYVDRLYYRRRAQRVNDKTRLIIVVDQSGSMIPAMINCTILASIFAGLPKVDAHLVAFDTQVIDLTQWINDPFEVLLHTKLGGGNDGPTAMRYAATKIQDPRNTVMVWISDFYDYQELWRDLHPRRLRLDHGLLQPQPLVPRSVQAHRRARDLWQPQEPDQRDEGLPAHLTTF